MPGQTSKLTQWRRIGALDMLLLQVIHGLAHGEHAGSSRDAKQLARFAAVFRDLYHVICTGYSRKWAGEKVAFDADDVALVRARIQKYLPRAAKLTYEERERLIVEIDTKSSLARAFKKLIKEMREAQAETLRVQAVFEANEKRREATRKRLRDEERQNPRGISERRGLPKEPEAGEGRRRQGRGDVRGRGFARRRPRRLSAPARM